MDEFSVESLSIAKLNLETWFFSNYKIKIPDFNKNYSTMLKSISL